MYFQISSLRRTARVLSEYCSVSKTAVWKWVVKLREKHYGGKERGSTIDTEGAIRGTAESARESQFN